MDKYTKAIEYFNGDELAAKAFINKYALKKGELDSDILEFIPTEMHWRLAKEFARIEAKYINGLSADEVFNLIDKFTYILPQGSPMAGIGNDYQTVSISNCFVIGNENDSYGSIYRIDEEQTQLMKRRGGVGHDLSHIRPKGVTVKNSALVSTGIVPFMERYSNSTREVAQDGRRGALMLSISINHPDSEGFIDAKLEQGKVTGANISVKLTNDFMNAVLNQRDFVQSFPVNESGQWNKMLEEEMGYGTKYFYNELVECETRGQKVYNKVKNAKNLWKKIIHNAWKSAEPGVLFWDTIISESIPDCYADLGFKTTSTNPCGEIPLCPYDSCRLLAINLYSYVKHPFTTRASFDFELFKQHVRIAQRMSDDIVDIEIEKIDKILAKIDSDPEDEDIKSVEKFLWLKIREKCTQGRRTGLGITAEGDMIAAMGLKYGTIEATDFSEEVHKCLAITAYKASIELAKERGAFLIWDSEKEENNPFIQRILSEFTEEEKHDYYHYGRRNLACLTIAPTGTTSLMTQSTSGIEPLFLPFYTRRMKINTDNPSVKVDFVDENGDKWQEFLVIHHKLITWYENTGFNFMSEEVNVNDLTLTDWTNLYPYTPYYKATSNDVNWLEKVHMQGRVQKWIDHSISVTVNLPADVSEELVEQVYMEAWLCGCKGCTIYRDGSRAGVLVSTESTVPTSFTFEKRPKELPATLEVINVKGRNYAIIIGYKGTQPYEIFAFSDPFSTEELINGKIIKKDSGIYSFDSKIYSIDNIVEETRAVEEGVITLFTSLGLRHNIPIQYLLKVAKKAYPGFGNLTTAMTHSLANYIQDGESDGEKCPQCGNKLVFTSGCKECKHCDYSACG